MLLRGGIKTNTSGILGSLAYWMIMLIVLVTFFNTLGLTAVSDLISDAWNFFPRLIIGILLLVVGMWIANFVKTMVSASLKNGNYNNADQIGGFAKAGVLVFVISLVLTHLGIGGDLIRSIIQVVLGALGIALALAFGLGGREWASKMISKHLDK